MDVVGRSIQMVKLRCFVLAAVVLLSDLCLCLLQCYSGTKAARADAAAIHSMVCSHLFVYAVVKRLLGACYQNSQR